VETDVSEPYPLTVLQFLAVLGWMLGLTGWTLWMWFTRDNPPAQKTPAKPPERAQDARKPPPASTDTPETVLRPLRGSGPLPPVPPRQWLEDHPEPTQFIRTTPPQKTESVIQPPPKDPWQEGALTAWREEQARRARREDR
jgi:hypothetical protein